MCHGLPCAEYMEDAPYTLHLALGLLPSTGGTTTVVADFAKAIPSKVVALTDAVSLAKEGSALRDTIHLRTAHDWRGRLYDWVMPEERAKLERLTGNAEMAVCHVLYRHHVHLTKRISDRAGIPYWAIPHGCLDPYAFSYRRWQKSIWMNVVGRSFLRDAAFVICATNKEKQKMAERYDGTNITVINWPVSHIDLSAKPEARARVVAELGIDVNARILLYFGRLHAMKRPLETIQAVAEAGTPNIHLVMVGPADTYSIEDCRRHALEFGCKNIHILGPVYGAKKIDYLHAADGFISLSHRENFGITAAEALMAGLPVILSPGNDLAGEFGHESFGWLLSTDGLSEAVSAIRAFTYASNDELKAIGNRARRWAQAQLSFEEFQSRVIQLRSETLARHRGR